jgi:hypothetical protein
MRVPPDGLPVPNGADIAKNNLATQWRNCLSTRGFWGVINGIGVRHAALTASSRKADETNRNLAVSYGRHGFSP